MNSNEENAKSFERNIERWQQVFALLFNNFFFFFISNHLWLSLCACRSNIWLSTFCNRFFFIRFWKEFFHSRSQFTWSDSTKNDNRKRKIYCNIETIFQWPQICHRVPLIKIDRKARPTKRWIQNKMCIRWDAMKNACRRQTIFMGEKRCRAHFLFLFFFFGIFLLLLLAKVVSEI